MFNVVTILESVRRHIVPIVVIVALFLGVGAASSFTKGGETVVTPTYTAEASIYVTSYGYGDDHSGDYNYSINETLICNEARRVVVSDAVAGEIRRIYGEDVKVTSPRWVDPKTNADVVQRFIYIDVVATDADLALEAANAAAVLAAETAMDVLPVDQVVVSESAYLKTGSSNSVSDRGKDAFASVEQSTVEVLAGGISKKTLVIYAFVGIVLSVVSFAAFDILSRRVRSPRDVERLLDVPVIATAKPKGSLDYLVESVRVLMKRHGLNKIAVAGVSQADEAEVVFSALAETLGVEACAAVAALAEGSESVGIVADVDAVLLVLKDGASNGSQIERAINIMKIADTPVLGAVFIQKR